MTNLEKLNLLKTRYNKMIEKGKAIKSPGVLRKLRRKIKNLEN